MPGEQELATAQELVVDLLEFELSRDPDADLAAEEIARRVGVREQAVEAVLRKLRRADMAVVREGEEGWTVGA